MSVRALLFRLISGRYRLPGRWRL